MSTSSYASDSSAASQPPSQYFIQSTPSRQSGMVQPVVQEMFATVHAARSSLFGLFIVHVQPSIRQFYCKVHHKRTRNSRVSLQQNSVRLQEN
eukprot:scaffold14470_cov107-Isochrysis_galbana.AAC.3